MGWSGYGRGGSRGYHHGNLREALIEAALKLIAKKGPSGFTLADAARSVGVSSAAPYRHFRDRNALIVSVARRGFELLAAHLDRAWSDGLPDPLTAFEDIGRAHIAFARTEPAFYSTMFEAGLTLDGDPGLREAADRSLAVLHEALEYLCARLPIEKRPPSLMVSLHTWAFCHGIASLFARGDCGFRKQPMTPEDMFEAGVLIYLRGLGLIAIPVNPEG